MSGLSGATGSLMWIVLMVVMMYFLILRPQKKQQKNREAMLSSLKKGDKVVTIGGIHGIVRKIKEDKITLEIATDVYVIFSKSAIASIISSDKNAKASTDEEESEETAAANEAEADVNEVADVDDVDYEIEKDEE